MPECEHCCDSHVTRSTPIAELDGDSFVYRLDERRVQLCPACVTEGERVWITVGAQTKTAQLSADALLALA